MIPSRSPVTPAPSEPASPEQAFFFGKGPHALFGILHEPPGGPASLPIVFSHPLAEEKLWAHRVFVSFARVLAERGHPVLRFDYSGSGDSGGDFAGWTIEAGLAELGSAVDEIKSRTGASSVGLLGLRLGATLAALLADERADVEVLALWAPIVDAHRYVQDLLRVNLTTQMAVYRSIRQDREALVAAMEGGATVNIDGYELSWPLYQQLSALRLTSAPKRFAGKCLVAHVAAANGVRTPADLEDLRKLYAGGELSTAQEEPFWKEIPRFYDVAPNLFSRTLEWLYPPTDRLAPSR